MSTAPIAAISANTPFLVGVPNSLVAPEWFRVLSALVQTGNSVAVIADPAGETIFDDPQLPTSSVDVVSQQALDAGLEASGFPPDDPGALPIAVQALDVSLDAGLSVGEEAGARALAQQGLDAALDDSFTPGSEETGALALAQSTSDQLQQLLEEATDAVVRATAALQDALIEQHMIVDVIRSMAQQEANAVAITGGSVNGTPIGQSTAAAGAFTTLTGSTLTSSGGFGCNGKTAQTSVTLPANATDLASVITLANAIKSALVADGIGA